MKYNPIDIVRQFLFVREADVQNTGQRVEAIQKWSGGNKGDSWCCEFATMVLDIAFQGNAPIPRLQACQDVYDLAKKNKWLVDAANAKEGDIILYVNAQDHAHHIGFLTILNNQKNILAGNTSADGTSSNGDRVAEHELTVNAANVKFVRYPKV